MFVVLIEDDELLRKYNKNWNKFSCSIKKEFDSERAHNEIYLRTKVKSYEGKINTDVHDNRISKEGSHCICFSVILNDSVL